VLLSPENTIVVGARLPNKLHPKNTVDAQFSAYFQLAHAWLYGSDTGIRCYERLEDEAIHNLSEKIDCVEDSSVLEFGSKLKIKYADGQEQEFNIPHPLGEPEHPFSIEGVEAKYFGLVNPAIGQERAEKIKAVVYELEKHTIAELMDLIA
jgi:2-methylcitrate dehydratase PrpD